MDKALALVLSAFLSLWQGILPPIFQTQPGGGGGTFTVGTITGSNSACVDTSASCTLTVPATTVGDGGILEIGAGANVTISSVSGGGGTWVIPSATSCANYFASGGEATLCAYNLNMSSSTTSISMTLSAAPGAGAEYTAIFFPYSYSKGAASTSFSVAGGRSQSSTVTPVPGVALTLSGGATYLIVQCMGYGGPTAISSPYTDFTNPGGGTYSCAVSPNTSSGTAPNWTVSSATFGSLNAIAIAGN